MQQEREAVNLLLEGFIESLQWRQLDLKSLRAGMQQLVKDIDKELEELEEAVAEHCAVCENSEWHDECVR